MLLKQSPKSVFQLHLSYITELLDFNSFENKNPTYRVSGGTPHINLKVLLLLEGVGSITSAFELEANK